MSKQARKSRGPSVVESEIPRLTPQEIFEGYERHLYSVEDAKTLMQMPRSTFMRHLKNWRETGRLPSHTGQGNRVPANKLDPQIRARIIEFATGKYEGFQATLLHKYLLIEGIEVSVETVRRILTTLRPEETPKERRSTAHKLRRRRSSVGELIQIDGSPHPWFEGTGDDNSYALLIFVDDATSRIMVAGFYPTETSEGYLQLLNKYIEKYGIPWALYSDRHSIFAPVNPSKSGKSEETQFQRVCRELGVTGIRANSPEAKGRVERTFSTLQGRWPKEFRVLGIRNMAEANSRMPELLASYNQEFAIAPADSKDSHAPLLEETKERIEQIFARWHTRMISRNLTVSYGSKTLQIVGVGRSMRGAMMKTECNLLEYADGRVEILWCDEVEHRKRITKEGLRIRKRYHVLEFTEHDRTKLKMSVATPEETAKTLNHRVDEVGRQKKGDSETTQKSPWHEMQRRSALKAMAKREELNRKIEEAKAINARIAAAKEKLKPKR